MHWYSLFENTVTLLIPSGAGVGVWTGVVDVGPVVVVLVVVVGVVVIGGALAMV